MAKAKIDENKKSFPMLPGSHWWKLRDQFKKSIPGIVSDTYLASVLNVQKISAQTNILPTLRQLKLIDEGGKTLDIAKEWRDDEKYPSVCEKMRKSIYPQELFDACPNPLIERESVKRWFAHTTGNGDSAVMKMVSIFLILVEADPKKKAEAKNPKRAEKPAIDKPLAKKSPAAVSKTTSQAAPPIRGNKPDVYINLQVHISADATADQIEKIFESMGKHIYRDN